MPRHHFSALTHEADDLTGTDIMPKPTADPHKFWAFHVHSNPKDNVRTDFTWSKQDDKELPDKLESSTSAKIGCARVTAGFTNQKFSAKVDKSDLVKGDFKLHANIRAEYKHGKDSWETEAHFHGNSPDMGGVTAHFDEKIKYNSKKETQITAATNFAHDGQHHFGFHGEHNLTNFTRLWVQAAFTPKEKNHTSFLRADILKHFVSLGHLYECSKTNATHAFELQYDASADAPKQPFLKQPITLKAGSEYRFSDKTSMHSSLSFGAHFDASQAVHHKINDNLRASIHQDFLGDSKEHKLGVRFSYRV